MLKRSVSDFPSSLRLLQATIAGRNYVLWMKFATSIDVSANSGVVILHLLLIPGVAFLVGGTEVRHQELHPHHSELNHSLLMIGYVNGLASS